MAGSHEINMTQREIMQKGRVCQRMKPTPDEYGRVLSFTEETEGQRRATSSGGSRCDAMEGQQRIGTGNSCERHRHLRSIST